MAGPCVGHTAHGCPSHLMSRASGVSPEQAVFCCLSEAELWSQELEDLVRLISASSPMPALLGTYVFCALAQKASLRPDA